MARRLLELDDWCARIRAGYLLEGKMFQHPHVAGRKVELPAARPRGDRGGEDETVGVIEQAAYDTFPYHKRFLVLRWLLEMTRASRQLRENVAAQAEDFSLWHRTRTNIPNRDPPGGAARGVDPGASSRGETEIGDSTSAPSGEGRVERC